MNAIDRGLGPDCATEAEIAEALGVPDAVVYHYCDEEIADFDSPTCGKTSATTLMSGTQLTWRTA